MATVTPGITWASGDVLNVSNMNLAANPVVTLANDEVTTAKILDANVTNAKIASGVDASKLTTGTLPVARLAAGSVTLDKLENVTAGRVVLGNASNVPTGTVVSGDVTITSSGVTSIGSAKVTAAKLDGAQTGNAPVFGVRAWVRFDATKNSSGVSDTATTNRQIIGAGNVASVLRTDEGLFTVTFTTAMPDANYCVVGSYNFAGTGVAGQNDGNVAPYDLQTGSFKVVVTNGGANVKDAQLNFLMVLR